MIGTAVTIAPLTVEIAAIAAGMAEHTVQNNADTVFFGGIAQSAELLVGAQQGIGIQIIGGVVAVVGMCFKNGVQINISHAHFLQVG